jgi:hypothetical protein
MGGSFNCLPIHIFGEHRSVEYLTGILALDVPRETSIELYCHFGILDSFLLINNQTQSKLQIPKAL